jgi:hypothetical protein
VAATAGTVFLLFPFVAIALGVLIVPGILAMLRNSSVGQPSPPPHTTTNTGEASYEPVGQPEERRRMA